jgi:hypothetical protein
MRAGLDPGYENILSAIPHITPFEGAWRDVSFNTSGVCSALLGSPLTRRVGAEAPFDRQLSHRVYEFFKFHQPYNGVSDLYKVWTPIAEKVSPSSALSMLVSKESLVWLGANKTVPVDYVNPAKVCTVEDVEATVAGVFASTRTYEVRYAFRSSVDCDTAAYTLPADQSISVNRFPVDSAIGVVCVLCACTGSVLCLGFAAFAFAYRGHKLLESARLSLTMVWFTLALVACCSPLFFLGTPSSALCQARNWAVFLPGFMLYSFLLAKVYHLSVVLNARTRRLEKASDRMAIMVTAFGVWNAPLILLLIIGSAYHGPSTTSYNVIIDEFLYATIDPFECENIGSGVYAALILYVALMVLFGEARAHSSPASTADSRRLQGCC